MIEDTEVKKAMKYLNSLSGAFFFRIIPGKYGAMSGKSDIIGCYNGLFIAIEMKVGSNKPSDLQERFLRNVQRKGGGLAVVCWGFSEVVEFMECIKTEMESLDLNLKLFQDEAISSLATTKMKMVERGLVDLR